MKMSNNALNPLQAGWHWLARNISNQQSFAAYFEPFVQMLLPQWRSDRYRSKVVDIRRESDDMYSLIIKPHRDWPDFTAGQYIELTIEKEGVWVSRFFSISSSPDYYKKTGLIEISIRIQENGHITPWLPKVLQSGGVVNLSNAEGDFSIKPTERSVLMIAGGSGITPFRSMLQQLSLGRDSATKPTTLMYYARSEEHFLFREELQSIERLIPNLDVQFIDTSDVGFFSDEHLQRYCSDFSERDTYICGPSPMILHAKKVLRDQSISDEHIYYEFFGPEPVSLDVSVEDANVLFQRSGLQVSTDKNESKTLLTLAEESQIKPVSGCRIGVCHQCMCEKKSGVVYNSKTKTYSDTGQEDIQLCVSIPVADVVLAL